MNYFIVNPGSTSKKYAFYIDNELKAKFHLEKKEDAYVVHIFISNKEATLTITDEEYRNPHKHIFDLLKGSNLIDVIADVDTVGIRIVAPGVFFTKNKEIDDDYIKKLDEAREIAPLHIAPVLEEIKNLQRLTPQVVIWGISDTAFHAEMPDTSKYYSINKKDADAYGLYRYGYHGISIQYSLLHLQKKYTSLPGKIIVCHLGGGSSITAVKNGQTLQTTMGFSPLEGVTMATRSGDIDPGLVLYLGKKLGMSYDELEDYLNKKSGLLGISNKKSDDVRQLLQLEVMGDADAKLALEKLVQSIKKYIGAYAALMNGVDMVVFSGTIGARSIPIRSRVCKDMEYLNIHLDTKKNESTFEINECIQSMDSKVILEVVNTDEMAEMVNQLREIRIKK